MKKLLIIFLTAVATLGQTKDFPGDIRVRGDITVPGTTSVGVTLKTLTTTQRDLLSPTNGGAIYNSTASSVQFYQGGAWASMGTGSGDALVANPLSQFAATTSAQFAGVISDETGSGAVVLANSPTLVTPVLGTPSALIGTNITGTAAGLTVGATTGVEAGADVTDATNVAAALTLTGDVTTTASFATTLATGVVDFDNLATDFSDATDILIGQFLEPAATTVTSNGVTITLHIEKDGGGDLRAIFGTGVYGYDTTPADTVTLTAGTDISPTLNYVYLLESTSTLTASTVGFPATEHVAVATVLCQSAASLQTDQAYKVHAWNDHTINGGNGHLSHVNTWIRNQHATWLTGVAQTLTITPGSPDTVIFTTTSGTGLQLHSHAFPAFAGTPDIYTVNDSATAYNVVTDLASLLLDSTGASMSGRRFALVIWGAISEATGDCKLFVNLPGGTYGSDSGVIADSEGYADRSIPADFKGVGFLISELRLRHQTSGGGTWTSVQEVDLRGRAPTQAGGGSGGGVGGTEFSDNAFTIFNNADNTKIIDWDASGITTGTTRTITMPDGNLTLIDAATTTTFTNKTFNANGTGNSLSNVDVADLANGTDGELITWSAAAVATTVAAGTSGQVLTSNGAGAAPTFQAATGGLANIVEDVTPQLGGALDVNGKEITGAVDLHSSGDLTVELGDAAGANEVDVRDSAGTQVAGIDSDGALFLLESAGGSSDRTGFGQIYVQNTAPNLLWYQGDTGTAYELTLPGRVVNYTATGSAVNKPTIVSAATGNPVKVNASGTDTNIGVEINPKGTGDFTTGTMVFDADQTIGAGQDNYVLTYDNASGDISLEAASGGGLSTIQHINFQARDMVAPSTGGAVPDTETLATSAAVLQSFYFVGNSDMTVTVSMRLPETWDGGTVKCKLGWGAATGASADDGVVWTVKAASVANDATVDATWGTPIHITDAVLAVGDMHLTPASGAVTIGGSPTAGDWIVFAIVRNTGAGGDNMVEQAILIDFTIEATLDAVPGGW